MEQLQQLLITRKETLAKFITAGAIATSIDISLYIFLYQHMQLSASVASTISFGIGAFFNFSLNNAFTFGTNNKSYFQKLLTFYEIASGGLLLNYSLISLLTHYAVSFLAAKIMVTSVVLVYNYIFQSKVTFK